MRQHHVIPDLAAGSAVLCVRLSRWLFWPILVSGQPLQPFAVPAEPSSASSATVCRSVDFVRRGRREGSRELEFCYGFPALLCLPCLPCLPCLFLTHRLPTTITIQRATCVCARRVCLTANIPAPSPSWPTAFSAITNTATTRVSRSTLVAGGKANPSLCVRS